MKSLKLNLVLLVGALLSTALVASTAAAQEDICTDFFGCLDACDEEDGDCVEQCVMAADPAVAEAFVNVVGCELGTECAEDDDACFEAACGEAYEALDGACFGEDPDIACFDFIACAQNCEEDDTACLVDCNAQSQDPTEQAAIGDFLNCAINSGCDLASDDDQCLEDACAAEIATFSEVCEFDDVANNGAGNNGENNGENNGDVPIGDNNGAGNNGAGNNGAGNNGAGNNGAGNNGAGNNGDGEENGADGDSDGDEESGCAVAPSRGGQGGAVTLLLLGLVALGLRRRA